MCEVNLMSSNLNCQMASRQGVVIEGTPLILFLSALIGFGLYLSRPLGLCYLLHRPMRLRCLWFTPPILYCNKKGS